MDHFIDAIHAAELAVFAMSARAILDRAIAEQPDVVSLRVAITHSGSRQPEIEWELINSSGLAVGGGGL